MNILINEGGALMAPEELTIHTVEQLRDDLITAINDSDDSVELSLEQLVHIDTAAVQVLLAARAFARSADRKLILANASDSSRQIIMQLGVGEPLFEEISEVSPS
jgi:anti-anti-sigma regulatory factor